MRYTMTFLQDDYEQLTAHLFHSRVEEAAFLLCGLSRTAVETRLLVRDIITVAPDEIDHSSDVHMQIQPAYLRAIKAAADRKLALSLYIHIPPDVPRHSGQDDKTETSLFRTAYNRIHSTTAVHASVVFPRRKSR